MRRPAPREDRPPDRARNRNRGAPVRAPENGISLVSVANRSAKSWTGDLRVLYPAGETLPSASRSFGPRPRCSLAARECAVHRRPALQRLQRVRQRRTTWSTPPLNSPPWSMKTAYSRWSSSRPPEAKSMLQLSREPSGPFVAGGTAHGLRLGRSHAARPPENTRGHRRGQARSHRPCDRAAGCDGVLRQRARPADRRDQPAHRAVLLRSRSRSGRGCVLRPHSRWSRKPARTNSRSIYQDKSTRDSRFTAITPIWRSKRTGCG